MMNSVVGADQANIAGYSSGERDRCVAATISRQTEGDIIYRIETPSLFSPCSPPWHHRSQRLAYISSGEAPDGVLRSCS